MKIPETYFEFYIQCMESENQEMMYEGLCIALPGELRYRTSIRVKDPLGKYPEGLFDCDLVDLFTPMGDNQLVYLEHWDDSQWWGNVWDEVPVQGGEPKDFHIKRVRMKFNTFRQTVVLFLSAMCDEKQMRDGDEVQT